VKLEIPNFPHASYDSKNHFGFLSYYYPHDAVKEGALSPDAWRHQSFSPDILNFKEDKNNGITFFVRPCLELVRYVLSEEGVTSAILIPIPSSMPESDKRYSRVPRIKGVTSRNRDDRNIVFCNLLSASDSTLQTVSMLTRVIYKPEKSDITVAEHAQTLRVSGAVTFSSPQVAILIDDVCTNGHTIGACRQVLFASGLQFKSIIALTIGKTDHPENFKPLT